MPPTLGQRLKHAREKRGLSLRDVEHVTKIPVTRLRDLEEDRLNTFGGMTYAKCFLKSYSSFLEVDAQDTLGLMTPPPLGGARDYRYLVESYGIWISDRQERRGAMSSAPPLAPGKSFLFATLVCLVFGLLIGGGVLASGYFNSKPASHHSSESLAPVVLQPSSASAGWRTADSDSPRKAEAVLEPAKSLPPPPKAEAVR